MDSRLLRAAAAVLALLLSHSLNISIKFGFIVTDWKFARVTPVDKGKGSRTDMGDFSAQLCLKNIIEKEIQAQFVTYFIEHDFIRIY